VAAPSNAIKPQALFDSSPSARQHSKVIKAGGFFLSGGVSVAMSREVLYVCVHIHRAERADEFIIKNRCHLSLSLSLSLFPRVDKGDTALLSAPLLMMPGRKTRTSLRTKAKSGIARTTLSAAGSERQGAPSVSLCLVF
jgi:hypothetical protein